MGGNFTLIYWSVQYQKIDPLPIAPENVLLYASDFIGVWRSGSAPVLGTGGRRFDPDHPDH